MAHHHFTRSDWIRVGVVIAVLAAALYFVFPFWPLDKVVQLGLDLQGGVRMVLSPYGPTSDNGTMVDFEDASAETKALAVEQVISILNNRTDQYGLVNPEIRPFGDNQVLVNLPGVTNTEAARNLIEQTAKLDFYRVLEFGNDAMDTVVPVLSDSEMVAWLRTHLPLRDDKGIQYILEKPSLLTGAALANASASTPVGTLGAKPEVRLEFTREGAEAFVEIINATPEGDLLAIVLDNEIVSVAAVRESIKEAALQGWRQVIDKTSISGNFTQEEATTLAIALRAGALPVNIRIEHETTIGPTLGADSIRRGMMTIAIGFVLILIYMFAFYRMLGFVANFTLVLNMLIVFAALKLFGAVLTLPGIAGIILTIGMTVDANVIIFERVKEERRTGKSPLAAVRAGFEKSLSTLFDANITTLITAFILLMLGTGPIRGFAVTLGIGVLGSLFCALVVSRLLMEKTGFSSFIPAKVVQEH